MSHEPLKIGLLVDTFHLPAWIRKIIEEIQSSDFAKVVLVVQKAHSRKPETRARRLWKHRARLTYLVYRRLDERLYRTKHDAFALADATSLLTDATHLEVNVRETLFCDYLSEKDIERIREADLDVLLRFGFRILRGSVLKAAKYGVWSYHHGDNHLNRGGPAGFWEVMLGSSTTGSILQILNEDLDNGHVIYRSYAKTDRRSVWRNRNNYYWKSSAFVTRQLRELAHGGQHLRDGQTLSGGELHFYSHPLFRKPSNAKMLAVGGRYAARRARERLRHVGRVDQWGIAIRLSDEPVPHTTLYRFKEICPPVGISWADPFPVLSDDGYHVFLEEYDRRTQRGSLSLAHLARDGTFENPVQILERPYHLSYPFVFEWRGTWFMVPETSQIGRVELYRASRFPHEWTPEAILFDSVHAVDSTLVLIGDRWWLFTSISAHPVARNYDELYAFHAATPLGPWIPHRRNPVKSDVRSARAAGRFFWKGKSLFRPAQDCSGRYGSATVINRIDNLTSDDFNETVVGHLRPQWRPGLSGTHTINSCPGLTVIDFRHSRAKYL